MSIGHRQDHMHNQRVSQTLSASQVFEELEITLRRVAPLKVTGPVYPNSSLAEDLDFDSLDTVELLIAVNEQFKISLDFETWLTKESERTDTPFTVDSLCQFIVQTMETG